MDKLLVKAILEQAIQYPWELQGMGMFRLRLSPNTRLHLWDHEFANKGVSMIHDHLQWALQSKVIVGQLINLRYDPGHGMPYMYHVLRAGVGCEVQDTQETLLSPCKPELYVEGDTYSQEPDEIHQTIAQRGTVTIMTQTRVKGENENLARVFWPKGQEWGTAEPRLAKDYEISAASQIALKTWF